MYRFARPVLIAVATLATAPAIAQQGAIDPSNLIVADDLEGARIYSDMQDGSWANDPAITTIGDDYQPIGSVEDVVLNMNGQMVGVVADIGGFLGIGDRHVLMPIENVLILPRVEGSDEYEIAVHATKAALEQLPVVEKGWFD